MPRPSYQTLEALRDLGAFLLATIIIGFALLLYAAR